MEVIYLASPYSHTDLSVMDARWKQVCGIAGRLMHEGHVVYSPIAHTHQIALQCALPRCWDYWERFDREFIQACEKVVVAMMDGWKESKGVQAEILIAKGLGKPVEYIEA